jgi:hypothetical protein
VLRRLALIHPLGSLRPLGSLALSALLFVASALPTLANPLDQLLVSADCPTLYHTVTALVHAIDSPRTLSVIGQVLSPGGVFVDAGPGAVVSVPVGAHSVEVMITIPPAGTTYRVRVVSSTLDNATGVVSNTVMCTPPAPAVPAPAAAPAPAPAPPAAPAAPAPAPAAVAPAAPPAPAPAGGPGGGGSAPSLALVCVFSLTDHTLHVEVVRTTNANALKALHPATASGVPAAIDMPRGGCGPTDTPLATTASPLAQTSSLASAPPQTSAAASPEAAAPPAAASAEASPETALDTTVTVTRELAPAEAEAETPNEAEAEATPPELATISAGLVAAPSALPATGDPDEADHCADATDPGWWDLVGLALCR